MADTATSPPPTRQRRRYATADIMELIALGLVAEGARFELWDGVLEQMSPRGPLHEDVRFAVMEWVRGLPRTLCALAGPTLHFDDESYQEPDYILFDRGIRPSDLKPSQTRLIIEVSDSSWRHDSITKAARYAAHGVSEYSAINATERVVRVHRDPAQGVWSIVQDFAAGTPVSARCAPEIPFTLDPA